MAELSHTLQELLRLPENSQCADCGRPEPVWASCNVGVFVCLECSGVHRISSIGRVKSLQLDYMEHDVVEFMRSHGNQRAKDVYEACVPPYYYRPTEGDARVLKEEWIRAKYERKEFTGDTGSVYAVDSKEGFLWKKGRSQAQYERRRFVYSEREGVLKYYTREQSCDPKGKFPVQTLNVSFQVEKMQKENGLEITGVQGGRTRSIYVYHDDGKEIVQWYNVLRYARYRHLKRTFPESPDTEIIPKITRNYAKSGYMEKTGPTLREAFKKRWFNLDSEERRLLYYKEPLDPCEQGALFLGSMQHGYEVSEGLPPAGVRGRKWDFGITVTTPDRVFVFTCESVIERREWLEAIHSAISRPMSEHHAREEARFRRSVLTSR